MVDRTMKGVFPILQMPFDDEGRIDREDLQREVDFAVDSGSAGVGIAFGSEMVKLTEAELELATRIVVEQAAGRVKVVINSGAQGTDAAVQYSQRAEQRGADALMLAPPTMFPAAPNDVREYFRRIAAAVSIPIFIQDMPLAPLSPDLIRLISGDSENACYAKIETPPVPPRLSRMADQVGDRVIFFGGDGGVHLLQELRRGAVGTMPHCACPDLFCRVLDCFESGDLNGAAQEYNRFAPLLRVLKQGGGTMAQFIAKEILRLRGVLKAANVRHPVDRPDDMTLLEVAELVESLGLRQ